MFRRYAIVDEAQKAEALRNVAELHRQADSDGHTVPSQTDRIQ